MNTARSNGYKHEPNSPIVCCSVKITIAFF